MAGERERQPKEGAAQQIEGIGADSVGPQVGGIDFRKKTEMARPNGRATAFLMSIPAGCRSVR